MSPRNAQPSANGAMLVDDGKTLLINDVIDATTTVYDVDPESKELTVKKVVVCSFSPSSPSLLYSVERCGDDD